MGVCATGRTWTLCIRLITLITFCLPPWTKLSTRQGTTLMVCIYSCSIIRTPHPTSNSPQKAQAPALKETPSNKELQQTAHSLFLWRVAADGPALVSGLQIFFFCQNIKKKSEGKRKREIILFWDWDAWRSLWVKICMLFNRVWTKNECALRGCGLYAFLLL